MLELRDALQDQRVAHVALLPGGSWNLSRQAWGAAPVLLHRSVLLEGVPAPDGQPPCGELCDGLGAGCACLCAELQMVELSNHAVVKCLLSSD